MVTKTAPIFSCRQCGECCWGQGGVGLNQNEAQRVAEYLHSPDNFVELYLEPQTKLQTKPQTKRKSKSNDIRTGLDGFCIFHGVNGQCLIHPVKPEVCRNWPFLPSLLNCEQAFLDAQSACPGLAEFWSWIDFRNSRK